MCFYRPKDNFIGQSDHVPGAQLNFLVDIIALGKYREKNSTRCSITFADRAIHKLHISKGAR